MKTTLGTTGFFSRAKRSFIGRRPTHLRPSANLRGRGLKGKGKGVFGREGNARGVRGGREGGREGNACQETIVFAIPPTNYVCKNNATVND